LIDLHSHLLPGVDDGARSLGQAVEALQRLAADGVREICLTPHLEASRIAEGPPPAHDEAFAALSRAAPPGIRLHRGAEVMLDRGLTPRAVAARRITLGGSRYVLVEFPGLVTVGAADAALAGVLEAGLVPLLAHPERYAACSVRSVGRWKGMGALMQVDATTVFQPTARGARARELLGAGLADVLASDNHGDRRSLAFPFEQLSELGGAEAALLMVTNPAAILADGLTETVGPVQVKLALRGRFKTWLEQFRS
jgi:protein-tyrosine phosphatase